VAGRCTLLWISGSDGRGAGSSETPLASRTNEVNVQFLEGSGGIRERSDHFQSNRKREKQPEVHRSALPKAKCPLLEVPMRSMVRFT